MSKKGDATPKRGRAAPRRKRTDPKKGPDARAPKEQREPNWSRHGHPRDPDELTDKERRFVEAYLANPCGAKAARAAGYAEKQAKGMAYQLLHETPRVTKAIEEGQKKLAAETELDSKWVLERLKENVDRAMQVTEVRDREGEPTGEFQYKGAVANKALELIGKHLGMYVEKHEHSGPNGGPIIYADLTDEQLDQRLHALITGAAERRAHGGA